MVTASDIRSATRSLVQRPGLTATAVVSLAMGIARSEMADRGNRWLHVVGGLRDGATIAEASCIVPARHASRLAPSDVLRAE
jgi:hypothetical protein